MSKLLKVLLIILLLLLTPFIYFWVRDVPHLNENVEEGGCVPYNVSEQLDRFSIQLTWETDAECVSYLKYSLNVNGDNWTPVTSSEEFTLETEHSVRIEDLKPGTEYYISIVSDGGTYGENNLPLKFRTED